MIHPRTLQALEFGKIIAWLTDKCVSEPGKAAIRALKPCDTQAECERQMQLYEQFRIWLENSQVNGAEFTLTAFPNVGPMLARTLNGYDSVYIHNFDLDAFWALKEMLRAAHAARLSINQKQARELWPQLLDLALAEPFPETLFAALNRCISDDGLLKDDSSPELWRIRNELRSLHQSCLRRVKDYSRQYNMEHYLQDDFMTLASDRYVMPLKANFKGRMQGIIHDWSQTGETIYFEPMFLVEVNNRLAGLKREEAEEERKVLDYLSSLLFENGPACRAAFALLGDIDVLNAKKLLSDQLDCHCPAFTPVAEGIELLKARHPLLALSRQTENVKLQPARPIDILLKPGERSLIITGGNAGGKTVCLKTAGLIAAMAMSALPCPLASGSHLPWFDRVDAFIGDEQSLDDNVSTFTAQIEHLAKAWKHLDDQSLVLLDEFGAGTDPAEGAALAQAVLDGLLEKKCFSLCATHFPALKSYALSREDVACASMLFNPDTNQPLFKLAYGQVGSSQALAVAREHGLPETIINRARHYLLQDGEDNSAILSRLNDLASVREKEIEKLKEAQARTKATLEEKRIRLDQERKRLQDEIRDKISTLMSAWKQGKINAKQAMNNLSRERSQLLPKVENVSILPEVTEFAPGKTVFHTGFNKSGVIMEIDARRKRVKLDMSGVTLWANMDLLREKEAVQKAQKSQSSVKLPHTQASLSLDVRGMRVEEAISETTRFLDQALLAGFGEIEIVHGRGTGVLRRQIHDFLNDFPAVGNISIAPEDRGGDGMTIVTLK